MGTAESVAFPGSMKKPAVPLLKCVSWRLHTEGVPKQWKGALSPVFWGETQRLLNCMPLVLAQVELVEETLLFE